MRKYKILCCILTVILAGCSFIPSYKRPALPTAASYPGVTGKQVPVNIGQLGWRDFFTDPRLQGLISQAIENNRDLRISMQRVEEARAQYGIQRSELLPSISAGALYSRSRTPADLSFTGSPLTISEYAATLNLSIWELDFWGRIRSLKKAALESFFATEEARRAAVVSLVAQVANTYLLECELDERIAIARKTITDRQESYRITRRRYEVGSAPKMDSVQAESLLNQARVDLADLQRQRDLNLNALTLLVGAPVTPSVELLSQVQPYFARQIPAGLPSDLLFNRPDVIAAEHQLKAENANIGAARADFFPSITMTGDLGTASTELKHLFGWSSRVWSFTPSIALPIFTGGRLRANLALSKALRNEAVAGYEKTIQTAFREVADALAERRWLAKQVVAQQDTLADENERVRLAWLRYQNGAASYLEVLDAQRDQYAAEQALVQARQALLSSNVNLYSALGGGAIGRAQPKPGPDSAKGMKKGQ